MNSREIVKPTGNIEIHPLADNGEGFFPPGTEWRVDSGYTFHFTDSGNLTVINPAGEQVWESATDWRGATELVMEPTGDLAIYSNVHGERLWHSNTSGHPGAFVAFQQDGNLVIYDRHAQPIWASGTHGK
ncbi:MAG: hypothetical protein ACJ8EL_16465 [Rhizomicrobium sp.]|jgi:hypothetical protein